MTLPPDISCLSSSEKDTLIGVLMARLDALAARVSALEAENAALKAENATLREKLKLPPKTPDNSSKPPSQGQKPNGETKTKPKGKAHAGAHRPLHPNPTRRRDVLAEHCPHCRADVTGVVQAEVQAYDRIEIPEITPDVTRVTLFGGTCPCCAQRFKATAPAGLEPGSPFGPNLRAFVLYLRFGQAIPFERLERLLHDLFGLAISEGALANMLAQATPAFEAQTGRIKQRLLSGTALESDETSVRVGKRTFWNWVFHHGDSACLAHLLRDIQYAIDSGDDALAPGLKALLKRATRIGRRRPDLADSTLAVYQSRLQARLDDLLKIVPATKAGQKLLRVIKRFRQSLFVFVTNRAIPATNNGSEQALRPCVVFRKVTNCFRSEWGATLYANVRSVVETARRRGIPILRAIKLTLQGTPLPTAA